MLYTEKGKRVVGDRRTPSRERDRGVTDLLLDVLEGVESYDAHIAEAEKDEDLELAAFLRELRRQDLVRSGEVARLLRRSRGGQPAGLEKGVGA